MSKLTTVAALTRLLNTGEILSIIRHKHIVENYKLNATVAAYYKLSAATKCHLSHVNTLTFIVGGKGGWEYSIDTFFISLIPFFLKEHANEKHRFSMKKDLLLNNAQEHRLKARKLSEELSNLKENHLLTKQQVIIC